MRSLPPVLEVILRAERRRPDPPTLEVDMRRIFVAGLIIWTVALAVCAVLSRVGLVGVEAVWSCVAGLALGLVGLVWDRLRGPTR